MTQVRFPSADPAAIFPPPLVLLLRQFFFTSAGPSAAPKTTGWRERRPEAQKQARPRHVKKS